MYLPHFPHAPHTAFSLCPFGSTSIILCHRRPAIHTESVCSLCFLELLVLKLFVELAPTHLITHIAGNRSSALLSLNLDPPAEENPALKEHQQEILPQPRTFQPYLSTPFLSSTAFFFHSSLSSIAPPIYHTAPAHHRKHQLLPLALPPLLCARTERMNGES